MLKKRTLLLLSLFICGLLLLLLRLVQLQLVQTESFSKRNINLYEESVNQRSQEIVIHDGRGTFLDRKGLSLTNQQKPVLVLFPFLNKMNWEYEAVAEILGIGPEQLKTALVDQLEPIVLGKENPVVLTDEQMNRINNLKIPGVFAVKRQYQMVEQPAEQLIGITGENEQQFLKRYPKHKIPTKTPIGLTGLEATFDEFLLPEGEAKLIYHVDAIGGPLFGIDVKYVSPANPFYPVNVKTTIDLDIQLMAEQLVDSHGIKKGGLILLDTETNTILAIVSRPKMNRSAPFVDNGVHQFMMKRQIVGSVFKTVVAAAVIENNLVKATRKFDCNRKIDGQPEKKYRHGLLDFTESFARSCNFTFGQLGKELKAIEPELLEKYAEKLALTTRVGWNGPVYQEELFEQLHGEEKGRVFVNDEAKRDDNFVALSAIGQHEVRLTPLAVANMMATIARGGKKEMVRAVSAIEYKDGSPMFHFNSQALPGERLAPYTVKELQKLLREVVVNPHGTGRAFQQLPYEVAGKSGTAQTGKFLDDEELLNKWFAGYFPYEKPKYALVTVSLDVRSSEGSVTPLFADMVRGLHQRNKINNHVYE